MRLQVSHVVASVFGLGLAVAGIAAQRAAPARDLDAEIRAAIQSAKTAAGEDFAGTLVRTCLLPQSGGENTTDTVPAYVTNPARAPARATWYAEPAKVFDNLYFVGGRVHSAWALTTTDGIILIDTIYPYNSEELIVGGLQKLGLDPKSIKYVIISHAHGDHIGGAEMLQTRYGARVVMGAPDWDLVAKYPNRYKTMAPKRDIVATDGMKITLGDRTVTTWLTPGHTPGTLSYTFTVLDRGKPVNVVYSGGTAFNFVNNTPDPGIRNFQTYIDSQKHIAAKAAETGATVLLSNHSEFDNAVNKNRMLAGRANGPHPYEVGADGVQRYFRVMQGCARAAQLRLEQAKGSLVLNPIAATSGTGISNVALINRDEIRVLRVDVAPNGVRNVHSHDDMQYHLFIPTAAGMQFESDSVAPVQMAAWQAQFIKGGTKHTFKNTSSSTVTIVEIFVKK